MPISRLDPNLWAKKSASEYTVQKKKSTTSTYCIDEEFVQFLTPMLNSLQPSVIPALMDPMSSFGLYSD